jgi:hypothetical protein
MQDNMIKPNNAKIEEQPAKAVKQQANDKKATNNKDQKKNAAPVSNKQVSSDKKSTAPVIKKRTPEQEKMAAEYEKMTGNKLIDSEDGKVKYKIKGKNNSFQKRS